MTLKERFGIRISRIKEYKQQVALCRAMGRRAAELKKNITVMTNADDVDERFACIKTYETYAPATTMADVGENVYSHIKYCKNFDGGKCQMVDCPYYYRNKQYEDQVSLLRRAMVDRQVAFQQIFARIK